MTLDFRNLALGLITPASAPPLVGTVAKWMYSSGE